MVYQLKLIVTMITQMSISHQQWMSKWILIFAILVGTVPPHYCLKIQFLN